VALHCRIILAAADGQPSLQIASALEVNRHTAALWRQRAQQKGIQSVWEIAPGRGRKHRYDQTKRDGLIQATLETKPKGMTHWSCRTMAKAQGVSKATVNPALAIAQSQAAFAPDFQIVARPKVFGEDDRRGRTLFESAAERPGLVLGRKEPDSKPWTGPSRGCH